VTPGRAREGHPDAVPISSFPLDCEEAVEPSPLSPPSPAAENKAVHGDTSGGDGSSAGTSEPSPSGPTAKGSAVPPVPSSSEPTRVRAVWAVRDGDHLIVALVPVGQPPSAEPSIFDCRTVDDAGLRAVLQLYGWSGRHAADGSYLAFFGEVYVTTQPHTFEDGTAGRVVSSCLGDGGAMAS
jgi:hypothetical protein